MVRVVHIRVVSEQQALGPLCDHADARFVHAADRFGRFVPPEKRQARDCGYVLLARKPWFVPIPDTTKMHRMEENTGAVEVELTSDDLRVIESAAAKITVQGARYPEKLEQLTGR